jgi:hypothetical protein
LTAPRSVLLSRLTATSTRRRGRRPSVPTRTASRTFVAPTRSARC